MNLECSMCYKKATIMAYGNSYCKECYKKSPYYAERQARVKLDEERKEREK